MNKNKKKITTTGLRGIINSFTLWKYIKAITTPFENTMAYRLGIIDAKGNYLKDPNKLSRQESNALTNFDIMIFNLKKLFDKIIDPSIKYKLKYIPTAIPLLAEEAERYGADGEFITEHLLAFVYDNGIIIEEVENDFLLESTEMTGHVPHIGELLYTGDHDKIINHLTSIGNKQNKLSVKVDGAMSVVFGKREGIPFARYKGKGAKEFQSHEELEKWAKENNKSHYIEPIGAALTAASHEKIGDNETYQSDIVMNGKGNLIQYKQPRSGAKHQIAVHGKYDSITGEKIESNPDVSHLSTDTFDFPDLTIRNVPEMRPELRKRLQTHISAFSEILAQKDVQELMEHISTHVDPRSKAGSRSAYLVGFSNAVQRGTHERSLEGFKKFTEDRIKNTKNKTDRQRYQAHYDFLSLHSSFKKLLDAHNHVDSARNIIIDHITPHVTSIVPAEGNQHEGIVSESGGNMIKLVPVGFSQANSKQSDKFAPKSKVGAAVLYSGKFGTITDAHTEMSKEGVELARRLGATHFVHGPTTSQGHLLSHSEKTRILSSAIKNDIGNGLSHYVTSPEANNPFKQIEELIGRGHRTIHFIGGSDRITTPGSQNLASSLKNYMTRNGGKWKTQTGELIDLDLQFHQVGETRNSESDNLSGISGTRLRNAIGQNDTESAKAMMSRHMSDKEKQNYLRLLASRINPIRESILSNLLGFLREDGEAVQTPSVINSVAAGGIAGLGQDASNGNVVVRKRPPILRRKKKK